MTTIRFFPPDKPITLNDRRHWAPHARMVKEWRTARTSRRHPVHAWDGSTRSGPGAAQVTRSASRDRPRRTGAPMTKPQLAFADMTYMSDAHASETNRP